MVVCKEWSRVQKNYWRIFMVSQSRLLVQTTSYANKFCSFYSIPEKRAYRAKMSYFLGLSYLSSCSGYLIMKGANKLQLMNPFIRKQMIIDTSAIEEYLFHYGSRVLLTFVKGSNEFFIEDYCISSSSLHVYQSRYSS
ncbi:transmembrane protein, putative [Medicago truncatula]|nr:transmembrane protein, putative [Medicago truncatula]